MKRHGRTVKFGIAIATCFAVAAAPSCSAASLSHAAGAVRRAAPGPGVQRPTADSLSGVFCSGPARCIAVGSRSGRTLAERWNGSIWTSLTTPSPGRAGSGLAGISCGSATRCVAVGSYHNSVTGPALPLAETWDGRAWRVSAPAATGGSLLGVSCPGPAWCMAVGYGSNGQNTSEQWDGTAWRLLPVPNIGGPDSALTGVSCTATASCVAVGSGAPDDESSLPYTVEWNGSSWQQLATPDQDQEISPGLSGVSCASATACVAVGSGGGTNGAAALALRWDGTVWQQLTTPAPASGTGDQLTAVSCAGASWCMAVGSTKTSETTDVPLAEQWTGGDWQKAAIGKTPGDIYPTGLAGVSCASATACLAGGTYTVGNGSYLGDAELTLDEVWNGTTWRTPRPSGYLIQLPGGGAANFHVSWYGSRRGTLPPPARAIAIAADQATGGYWILDTSGGVSTYNAPWWGSQRGRLPAGVTPRRIAADPAGLGYWVLDSNGGVANYNAPWYGSQRGSLSAPVAGIAADPATGGYWILDANGSVHGYHAAGYGSQRGRLPAGVRAVSIAAAPATGGYWILDSDGGVGHFHAPGYGSQRGHLPAGVRATAIAADPATGGYWILDSNGGASNYHAPWYGSLARTPLASPPTGLASQ